MPLITTLPVRDSPSPDDSEAGSGWSQVNVQQIVDDNAYAAKLYPEYVEKPLSEQLEPIAVVGMGCRLPGDVKSTSDFWELMMSKKTGNSPKVPESRFNIDAHFHENNDRPGSFNVLGGYFLNETLQEFDPSFFGITPIEAMWMDPQQRKLLEVVYETLESAGVTLDMVAGSKTAVFAASFTSDFQQMCFKEPSFRHSFAATGVDPGIISNRISHVFNLKGPSIVVNTACSSSVYALHNACNSLRNKECVAAIVGGVNLVLTVDQHMNTAKLGVLSPTSTCHTFDASADGYGRAEGVGAVYLKRLSDAIRDGDPVRAVIRSSATNNNGKVPSVGITHPNRDGQVEVITHAYSRGGNLDPRLTGYVECHGTGTAVGDPLEVHAVSLAMNENREPGNHLMIGAVKTNIGHSEAASGLSALIKAVLSVERGVVLPTRGLVNPSPMIKWDEWLVKVPTEPSPFPDFPVKRVSVNSFGYGGTNAHVIVEGAASLLTQKQRYKYSALGTSPAKAHRGIFNRKRPFLLPFSAHDKAALHRNIAAHGAVTKRYDLLDLSYTLANHRSSFSSRGFTVTNHASLKNDKLEGFTFAENKKTPSIAFVFTGQGAQWARMGAELMTYYPSFLRSIRILDMALGELEDGPEWTLEDTLLETADTSPVNEAEYAQPLTTAIQIALVQLLRAWSIFPAITVGHSSGEIAAAYAAGYISASDAIVLAYLRGKVVSEINSGGAMMAVGLGAEAVNPHISKFNGRVTVACHNSPSGVTLSGDADAIEELRRELESQKIFARLVKTGGKAYHSSHMAPASAEYERLFRSAKDQLLPFDIPVATEARMVSSVTASLLSRDHVIDEKYFSQNLRQPVLFNQAVQAILTDDKMPKVDLFIEVGPHSALGGPIRQIKTTLGAAQVEYLPTLTRGEDSAAQILKLAGELFLRDYPLDLERISSIEETLDTGKVLCKRGNLIVDLPPYQWGRKAYWAENRSSKEHRAPEYQRHDLLGSRIPGGSQSEPTWRNFLRIRDVPWLKDHSLGGEAVFPAAGYFSMAMEAITQITEAISDEEITNYVLRDVSIKKALITPDDDIGIEVLFNMRPAMHNEDESGHIWWDFNVSSIAQDGELKNNMTGTIRVNARAEPSEARKSVNLNQRASGNEWNQALRSVGFDYGSTFADMTDINFNGVDYICTCKTKIKDTVETMQGESRHVLHPATVDSTLQLMIASVFAGRTKAMSAGVIPIQVDEVSIWKPTAEQLAAGHGNATAWTHQRGVRSFVCDNQLVDKDGHVLMEIKNLRGTLYDAAVPQSTVQGTPVPYNRMLWKPDVDTIETFDTIGEAVELMVFKNPKTRVLDIGSHYGLDLLAKTPDLAYTAAGECSEEFQASLAGLKNAKILPDIDFESELSQQGLEQKSFDLIISTDGKHITQLVEHLTTSGQLVVTDSVKPVKLIRNPLDNQTEKDLPDLEKEIQVVYSSASSEFLPATLRCLASVGLTGVPVQLLQCNEVKPNVVLLDIGRPLLANITEEEFGVVKQIAADARTLLWVTNGDLLSGRIPEASMASGLTRSIRSETATINIVTLDFDLHSMTDEQAGLHIASKVLQQVTSGDIEEEYCVSDNKVYISRLTPHDKVNAAYSVNHDELTVVELTQDMRLKGKIHSGKVVFANEASPAALAPTDVEIRVSHAGMNRKTVQVISGSDISTDFSHEIGGVVVRIGADVKSFAVGDRVAGFSFSGFDTYQTTSEALLQKVLPGESLADTVALMMAFASALHGLKGLANIQPGDVALVLPGTGSIGAAAVQILKKIGVDFFMMVSNEAESDALMHEYGLLKSQILSSTGDSISFLHSSHQINVVIGSPSTLPSISREAWRFIAPFGRYIDCGRRKALKRDTIDSLPFQRGASYYSFDLVDLCRSTPLVAGALLAETFSLYRDGSIAGFNNVEIRSIAELDDGVARFTDDIGSPKTVFTYEKPSTSINLLPITPEAKLRSKATYLLIGCLGGLGRSLTAWMMKKGARNFCFLSRSGADGKGAALLVKDLEAAGASVQIVRGDVSIRQDVERAVASVKSDRPICGVVHAAMVLRDSLFCNMKYDDWVQSTRPKVTGAANLQAVLGQTPLDFFLVTSSVSGILGTPGQPSYASANAYLDALALHRRSRGQVVYSAVLPMVLGVGVVSENVELEASLKRKGMYGIDEEHLLRSLEIAIMEQQHQQQDQPREDGAAQLVIGLDPTLLSRASQDADSEPFWTTDRRFRSLVHQMKGAAGGASAGASVLSSMLAAPTPLEAVQLARDHVVEKLSRMLLLDLDVFEGDGGSIASYGIDSMIGAELRNWLFKEFALDIPFQKLLAPTLTARKLAEQVCAKHEIIVE
ncbi:putative polyketide synthase [Xylaria cf. heliscus]|nr:putative polyketide synthase [Xylaria cf. heliscus]